MDTRVMKRSIAAAYSLVEWMRLTADISNNGEKVIANFNQVPKKFQDPFHHAVKSMAMGLKPLNQKERLAFRAILVKEKPSLLGNFDEQFGCVMRKSKKRTSLSKRVSTT